MFTYNSSNAETYKELSSLLMPELRLWDLNDSLLILMVGSCVLIASDALGLFLTWLLSWLLFVLMVDLGWANFLVWVTVTCFEPGLLTRRDILLVCLVTGTFAGTFGLTVNVLLVVLGRLVVFTGACLEVVKTLEGLVVVVLELTTGFVLGLITSWWILMVVLATGFKLPRSKLEPFFKAAVFRAAAWEKCMKLSRNVPLDYTRYFWPQQAGTWSVVTRRPVFICVKFQKMQY